MANKEDIFDKAKDALTEKLKEKNIEFDIKNVAPVFNELYEYEDEFLAINYDENTKIGKIKIL